MHTLANSEDPDEMRHNAAFHQGLHYLFATSKLSSVKKKEFLFSKLCTLKDWYFAFYRKYKFQLDLEHL